VRVDLEARSRPLEVQASSDASCPVAGPEFDMEPPELDSRLLGWPANHILRSHDGLLFPMHPRLSALAVVDPCDADGFRPRVLFLLRGSVDCTDRSSFPYAADSSVLDTFTVVLPWGAVPAGRLPVPPGASADQGWGRIEGALVQVGDESLKAWADRVTEAMKPLDPYASPSGDERRILDSLLEAIVWPDARGSGRPAPPRTVVLEIDGENSRSGRTGARHTYRIAVDQRARRFVPAPEVRE